MDDIRRPYRGERRDYAIPARRPHAPHPPVTDLRPAAPAHHPVRPPHHAVHQTHHQTDTFSPTAPPTPVPTHHQPRPAAKRLPKARFNKQMVAVVIFVAAAIFGGYLLLKPNKAKVFTPASLAKQASFGFYYPSPLPSGYSYISDLNTFQDGQAYYMLGSGSKHIIIREQAASGSSLKLDGLSNPVSFPAAGGKAAIGSVSGQPGGTVLTGSTLITLNSTGAATAADIAAAINSLKPLNR